MNLCAHRSIRVAAFSRGAPADGLSSASTACASPLCSAFTLIELMVVMVLIGILSAMILPEMKGTYGDALLRSSGRELVNVFSLAYSQAVSLNQLHIVRFDQKDGRYSVERQLRSQSQQPQFVPLKEVAGSSGRLDHRIIVEVHKQGEGVPESAEPEPPPAAVAEASEQSPENSVTFYPDGTADGAEILLRDRAGFGLRLRIDPITARVEVSQLTQGEPKR